VTNLLATAGHFVSYRWAIGQHNFLVILWNLLVQDCWSRLNAKVQDCWSCLNASRTARNSFVGRMFVTPALDHIFSTQNPSKSSKVSKDSDCGLVSNKNFSEIIPSSGLGAGPGEVGQGSPKALHLWCHSQKTRTPQPKKFFWVQTTRLSESFELLTGSVALTKPEKFLRKATCDPAVFSRTAWINPGAKVLNSFSKCLN